MEVTIDYLADHPGTVRILAQWLFDEWGHQSPDGTVQGVADILNERRNRDKFPMAFVAIQTSTPVGTASLKIREVDIRPEYEHWLGAVYVQGRHRGKGVGSLLIGTATEEAANLGINELYLYTRQKETERLYESLGWTPIERPHYRGSPAVIMKIDPTAN